MTPASDAAVRALQAAITLHKRGFEILRGDGEKIASIRPPVKLAVITGGRDAHV